MMARASQRAPETLGDTCGALGMTKDDWGHPRSTRDSQGQLRSLLGTLETLGDSREALGMSKDDRGHPGTGRDTQRHLGRPVEP